ncbi:uncharacterized protein LOC144103260 [Amblyomma americanum]
MATEGRLYTVVGFTPELDWRPLHFVGPLPRVRACSACSLVRPKTVVCWNEKIGCSAVMAASDMFKHFQRDCGHHSAHCPKCAASVLCRDMCAHLRSNCADTTAPLASGSGGHVLHRDESPALTHNRGLEEQAGEIKALLEQLVTASSEQGDRLSEISHGQNWLTETLKHDLKQHAKGAIDAAKAEVKEISQKTLDSIGLVVGHSTLQVYLRGYCMSPGISLIRTGKSVTLLLSYQLHKGDMDDVLQWPFEHTMRLSVIHPEVGAKRQLERKPWRIYEENRRPAESSNLPAFFAGPSIKLSDLTRDGYLYEGQLRPQRAAWKVTPTHRESSAAHECSELV